MLPTISTETPPRRPRQLWLFPVSRPLTERLGRAFFSEIPRAPGVYFMYGQADKLLYIGQSQELRQRLNSYRHVHPDRDSRRLVRLVHAVHRIEWRICNSAEAAIRTEKELLLALRPRFNRASVWPAPQWFIELRAADSRLNLTLLKDAAAAEGRHGPFGGAGRQVFASLLRLAYLVLVRPESLAAFPSRLLTQPPAKGLPIAMSAPATDWVAAFEDYLALRDQRLVSMLEAAVLANEALSPFERVFWETELDCVREFFDGAALKIRLPP